MNPLVAIAAILLGERENVGGECGLIIGAFEWMALHTAALPQRRACTVLRHPQLLVRIDHSLPTPHGAG